MFIGLLASLVLLLLKNRWMLLGVGVGSLSLIVPWCDALSVLDGWSFHVRQPYIWNHLTWGTVTLIITVLLLFLTVRTLCGNVGQEQVP